ncbi:MAG TPA: PASTA domain-containing protein [Gaiellaceae bacterium]
MRGLVLLAAAATALLALVQPVRAAARGVAVPASSASIVDFTQLARFDGQRRAYGPLHPGLMPEPQEKAEPNVHVDVPSPFLAPLGLPDGTLRTPSPAPAQSFLAQLDHARDGTTTSFIPPDTAGAVGPTRLMSTLNSNYVIQDRSGKVLASVSMSTFWASVGAAAPFDPRVLYDPYSDRWLAAAVTDPGLASSAVLYGISDTGDPGGSWHLYSVAVDPTGSTWADFPTIGFDQSEVAIGVNLFTTVTGEYAGFSKLLVIDYPALKANAAQAPAVISIPGGFTVQPAVTYSPTESTLYLVEHGASSAGTYFFFSLIGTTLSGGAALTNPLGPWTIPGGGNLLPQRGGYPVDSADARIGNAVFRDGHLYYAQTVGLPAGGYPGEPRRTAVQWVELDRNGAFVQGGRIADRSATETNGGSWYAYPSISVNAAEDVLVGFSVFRSDGFPSAGYAFRYGTDPKDAMRKPVVLKAGQGTYYKTFGGDRNRWGDYSATQVDPLDDRSLWTIQEYAAKPAGAGDGSGRWATWWGRIDPSAAPAFEPTCQVPRVLGLRLAQARARIRSRHCRVGKVSSGKSGKHGRVIAQSPRPGRHLGNDGRVNLTVAR